MGGNNGRAARETVLQARCVELRLQGLSYRAIGAAAGCSHVHAWRLITRAMETVNDRTAEDARVLRTLEAERLDAILQGVWDRAAEGDLPAVDRVLKIMERRARLFGLDAPAKVAPTTPEGDGVTIRVVYEDGDRYGTAPGEG